MLINYLPEKVMHSIIRCIIFLLLRKMTWSAPSHIGQSHTNTTPCPNKETHSVFLLVFMYEHKAKMKGSPKRPQSDHNSDSTSETWTGRSWSSGSGCQAGVSKCSALICGSFCLWLNLHYHYTPVHLGSKNKNNVCIATPQKLTNSSQLIVAQEEKSMFGCYVELKTDCNENNNIIVSVM